MVKWEKYGNFIFKIGYDGQVYQIKKLTFVMGLQTFLYEITEKSDKL